MQTTKNIRLKKWTRNCSDHLNLYGKKGAINILE